MSRHPGWWLPLHLQWVQLSKEAPGRQVAPPARPVSPNAYFVCWLAVCFFSSAAQWLEMNEKDWQGLVWQPYLERADFVT